ncbi:sporulation protein YqfD [Bacillus xiapuensis]|uniref:sporulation protein YqfD n=1 Tax=Bacillus xiapuensis TaxID=2014075 RepID=UPI000C24FC71|nr:sporulation protein YqfD [Bacillus xiapuensis]
MNNQWLAFVYGIVHVKATGAGTARFINQLNRSGIPIWQIKHDGEGTIRFSISLRHLSSMRKCARQFDGEIIILKGEGLPFLTKRLLRSAGFLVGAIAFLFLVLLLSNIIWRIDIEGASPEMEHKLRKQLDRIGVQKGKLILAVDDPETVQRKLFNEVEGLTWVGVELRGSTYHFRVVEKHAPKERKGTGPRHLVSAKDAVVIKMYVEKGQSVVKRNQFVRKGQLLVSGYIGNEEKPRRVAASGKVYGETWYKTTVELPLATDFYSLSGHHVRKHWLKVKGAKLPVWGFQDPEFTQYKTDEQEQAISFLGIKLPVTYVKNSYYESRRVKRIYSEEEAERQALKAAEKDLLIKLPEKSKIIGKKILHKQLKNGKVSLSIHFQVLEDIAIEQRIIQGDIKNAKREKHNEHST